MISRMTLTMFLCLFLLEISVGCSNGQDKAHGFDSIRDGFFGIKWGEDFDFVSKLLILEKTKYGGNDNMPVYQVLSQGFSEYHQIPVIINFQFASNKLNVGHIRVEEKNIDGLVSAAEKSFGKPTARPSKDTVVWQDSFSTIILQKTPVDGRCLLSIVNNENYLRLTGKKVHLY